MGRKPVELLLQGFVQQNMDILQITKKKSASRIDVSIQQWPHSGFKRRPCNQTDRQTLDLFSNSKKILDIMNFIGATGLKGWVTT
jgi:hypothetical protein